MIKQIAVTMQKDAMQEERPIRIQYANIKMSLSRNIFNAEI